MRRTTVRSSSLKSLGYDPATRTLEVEFSSGAVYRYPDIPPDVHAGLLTAESLGRAFHATIRQAGFAGVRVEADTAKETEETDDA